jgi:hypothetical protein
MYVGLATGPSGSVFSATSLPHRLQIRRRPTLPPSYDDDGESRDQRIHSDAGEMKRIDVTSEDHRMLAVV